ncbi:hypothetical protein Hanom_Chr16g01448021 [Helianthus anomalus]
MNIIIKKLFLVCMERSRIKKSFSLLLNLSLDCYHIQIRQLFTSLFIDLSKLSLSLAYPKFSKTMADGDGWVFAMMVDDS